jgi:hypothetical protein
MSVEQLDQLGEVGERAGEAVDLVDHDDVDSAGSYVVQKLLQSGALGMATREAAVIVTCL